MVTSLAWKRGNVRLSLSAVAPTVSTVSERQHRQLLRALQNSNSSNNHSHNSAGIVAFVFILVFVFLCVVTTRACKSEGDGSDQQQPQQQQQQQGTTTQPIASLPPTASLPRSSTTGTVRTVTPSPVQQRQTQGQPPQRVLNTHLQMEISSKIQDRREIEYKLVTRHFLVDQDSSYKDCSICLSSFQKGEEVAESVNPDCKHLFHTECIIDWLLTNPACPECRRDFITPKP